MSARRWIFVLILAVFFSQILQAGTAFSGDSEVVKNFKAALVENDEKVMYEVVEQNKEKIPAEVKALMDEAAAPGASEEVVKGDFYVAELMATIYKNLFQDVEPLRAVKKKYFETLLTPQVRSTAEGGVHIITMPTPAGEMENVFKPDNIIIKKGETVRFVNNDAAAHILASLAFLGEGGLFSPNIETGQSWEYKFEKPGEYYYICFIHKSMAGKITVEEAAK